MLKRLEIVDEKLKEYEEILRKTYGKEITYNDAMQTAVTSATEDYKSGNIRGLDKKGESR